MELESDIERYFVTRLTAQKCMVFKFVSPGHAGVPDRLVIAPSGRIYFVELKRPTGKLRKLQEYTRKKLQKQNCDVRVVMSKKDVDYFVNVVIGKDGENPNANTL